MALTIIKFVLGLDSPNLKLQLIAQKVSLS